MKYLFFFLFLLSCTSLNLSKDTKDIILDFDKDLTFEEFNNLLIIYTETNPYPNIDK